MASNLPVDAAIFSCVIEPTPIVLKNRLRLLDMFSWHLGQNKYYSSIVFGYSSFGQVR